MVIAIDGPAGAGKSTVARATAQKLGFTYMDSGAMYRAVALSLLRDPGDPAERAASIEIDFGDPAIRTPEVSEAASRVATDKRVREALVERQRDFLDNGGDWVAEGRDIGTVVAPHAELKVFLTASPEERARRRAADLGADPEAVLTDLRARDERDTGHGRTTLAAGDGVVELDTTGLALPEVVSRIAALVRG
jgi:CMP/dCMP kinase